MKEQLMNMITCKLKEKDKYIAKIRQLQDDVSVLRAAIHQLEMGEKNKERMNILLSRQSMIPDMIKLGYFSEQAINIAKERFADEGEFDEKNQLNNNE